MAEYSRRIAERTNGRVEIQMTSFAELGLAGPDTLRLIGDGTLEFGEVYSGYVGGDLVQSLGGEGDQFIPFAEVYAALERGILPFDAALEPYSGPRVWPATDSAGTKLPITWSVPSSPWATPGLSSTRNAGTPCPRTFSKFFLKSRNDTTANCSPTPLGNGSERPSTRT